jgi:hypothetical protein
MSWNIQDLGINKLHYSATDPALLRANHIIDTILLIDPDILVVVEVESALPYPGRGQGYVVADTSGGPAVRTMLAELHQRDAASDWRLVPPLLSGSQGQKEGVAVFFKNTTVNFRGPQQVDVETIIRPRAGNLLLGRNGGLDPTANGPYPPPWDWVLPATQPAGPAIGPGAPKLQNQLCGKPFFELPTAPNVPMNFPWAGNRSPFLTGFRELAGGAAARDITVLGCHLPPHFMLAGQAVDLIMQIPEMISPMGANDVRIICGDFNINFNDPAQAGYWNSLIATNVPRPGGNTQYQMLHATDPSEYKVVNQASLAGVGPHFDALSTGYNPWTGTYNVPGVLETLDGIFGAFGTAPGGALGGRVVNRVVDTPFVAPPLPPPAIPQAMAMTAAALIAWDLVLPPPVPTGTQLFRQMANFGHIRGASDHLPVYADF